MKTNKWRFDRGMLPFALLLVTLLLTATGCKDLLEDKSPGWLGSSIYDNLKNEGRFENMTKLIDELGYKEVLAKTGSKTLLASPDSAFEKFYAGNDWGVSKYSDFTLAQKKMLLYGALINNSYPLNMLSSSQGPNLGDCMRRNTSMSVYDSVSIAPPSEMIASKFWSFYKDNDKSLVLMKDNTPRPIVHFLQKQLSNNNITNSDVDFLMNYKTIRKPGDASINGIPVIEANRKCSNGFVHVLGSVLAPMDNMAELIRKKPNTTIYSKLLERYSVPFYDAPATASYNLLYGTSVDSVFVKRYFSARSLGGAALISDRNGRPGPGQLKFDPGWNGYFLQTSSNVTASRALQQDMGVMIVPSDAAFKDYFDNKAGKVLRDNFRPSGWPAGDYSWIDLIPTNIITELLNVNMLTSFKQAVPSRFTSILDDATYPLGITTSAIDSVYLACNGVIYQTNKVFSPTSFSSVSFPTLVNSSMSIINWAIEQKKYNAYLNAKEATFSLFIPTNEALTHYIDPVSYGKATTKLYKFRWNPKYTNESNKVVASVWDYDVAADSIIGSDSVIASYGQIINRLYDILETHTVIGDVESGNVFYRTKGGTTLRVDNTVLGENGMSVSGSRQIDTASSVPVKTIYQQGNGKAYILAKEPIMTTKNSVADVLEKHPEFIRFSELLNASGFLTTLQNNHANAHQNNIGFFSKFHYTVYVPLNDSIEALQTRGILPTLDKLIHNDGESSVDSSEVENNLVKVRNFVQYHIHDNAVFLNPLGTVGGKYETALYNSNNNVFYGLEVLASNNTLTVTDQPLQTNQSKRNVRHVIKTNGLYNLMAREYQYNSNDPLNASELYSSAEVVIHQIDGALFYK